MKRVSEDVSARVQEILATLTLEERASLVTGHGSWHTKDCHGKVPVVTMSDGPHGLRKQDEEDYADINHSNLATCFPTGSALSSTWSPALVGEVAKAISEEAKAERVSVVLGPAVNVKRNPLCGRNFEYYSEDPYLAGTMATAYVQAMEGNGVGTSLKHYACNNQETHRQTSNSRVDDRAMHEIYLKAFRMCVTQAQPSTIMSAYNRVNGTYACASTELQTEILRDQWHYEGALISDWGATMNIVDCIKSGLDLEMPDSGGYHTKELLDAIDNGRLTEEQLNRAAGKVIELALRRTTPAEAIPCSLEEHHELARKVSAEAAVLLKHTGAFPISKEKKILLVGSMATKLRFQGGGSSHITTAPCKNVVEALTKDGYQVTYSEKPSSDAAAYDQIIYFGGLTDAIESEGYDRSSLDFPEDQLAIIRELLAVNPHVSVVTFGGAPFVMPFYDDVAEVLHMHLGGQAVGEACALLISGQINPSGHLTETWPCKLSDVPNQSFFGRESNDVPYVESVYVGYRYYETARKPVQFEFGYGLSYTSFAFSNLSVNRGADGLVQAHFTITNTGSVAGATVAQIYVQNSDQKCIRPCIALAGFQKEYLMPGESRAVTVPLDEEAFAVYDIDSKKMQNVAGTYTIALGDSVRKLMLSVPFEVEGMSSGKLIAVPQEYLAENIAREGAAFTLANFDRYYAKEYENYDQVARGGFTRYHSMEQVCKASVFGRMLLGIIQFILPIALKSGREDAATKMVLQMMKEAPLDSLISVSGGVMKPNLSECLVLHANKHPFKAWGRLFRGNPKTNRRG